MSEYARYPEYKDSGVPWLGEIPSHWLIKRLKFVLTENLKYGSNEASDSDDRTEPRYIRITDIKPNGNLKDDIFQALTLEKSREYLLKDSDILLARSGSIGRSFLYIEERDGIACHAGYLIRARANNDLIKSVFLFNFLQSSVYWDWVNSINIQSTIQNISAEKYNNLHLPLPSIDEQSQIIIFLDTELGKIDALIDKQQLLLDKLAEQRSAVITQAVTKGLNPNAEMKDSGVVWLGNVPSHWQNKRLKFSIGNISEKVDAQTSDLRYFGLENIQSFTAKIISDVELMSEGVGNAFQKGDVLFGKLRPYLAKVYLAEENGLSSTEALVFRAKKEILPQFLKYYCLSPDFISAVNGTTFGSKMPRASWEDISSFRI